jgi:biopolymer transport protein ExbD
MKTRNKPGASSPVNLGFQIAPMIDVVFVIMLFFMVMAGSVQTEKRNRLSLPTIDGKGLPPDEVMIKINDDGQVSLNDDPLDSPSSPALPELADHLRQLRESAQAAKSELLVTIHADEAARYQRVMDTLDALSLANIAQVTFEAVAPE